MRFIPYARASTKDKQHPEHQLPEIERWAAGNGHELLSPVIERDSGRNDDRPAWNDVLLRVLHGDADGVVAVDLSRFARSTSHLLNVATALRKANRHLACTRQQIDTSSAFGRFAFTIFAAMAELTADAGRESISKGIRFARAKRGGGDLAPWGRRRELPPVATLRAARDLLAAGLSWRRVTARLYAVGHAQPERKHGRSAHMRRPWPIGTLRDALASVELPLPEAPPNPASGAGQ